jgi:hypothetical protein
VVFVINATRKDTKMQENDFCPYKVMQCGPLRFCDHKKNKNRQIKGKRYKMRVKRSICLNSYETCPYIKNNYKEVRI